MYDGMSKYDSVVAEKYDVDREVEEHWHLENKFISDYFANAKHQKIAEIPVGTGRFLGYFAEADTVIGVDISNDMLAIAKKRVDELGLTNVELEVGDATNLRFENDTFDCLVSFRLLHLIPPAIRLAVFSEFARVTKGKIIVQVYQNKKLSLLERVINKFNFFAKKIIVGASQETWLHIQSYGFSSTELEGLLLQCRLHIVESKTLCEYGASKVNVVVLEKNV